MDYLLTPFLFYITKLEKRSSWYWGWKEDIDAKSWSRFS